jgi:hypothetical protein
MTAILSPCGRYRYTLERPIALAPVRWLLWVMLNPSVATADVDDPTIRRVIGFTRAWGYDGALVGNLYAFRATQPFDLWAHQKAGVDIVGPDNNEHLNLLLSRASGVVIAWGANAERNPERANYIERMLRRRRDVYTLGFTTSGQPVHPLRQPASAQLVRCER